MNAAPAVPKKRLTAAEYLAIENAAQFKSEFFDGVMYPLHGGSETAMASTNPFHNRIKENLVGELFSRFGDGPCQSYSSDQRVWLNDTGMCAYPDVVIEVLSPSTEAYDRGFKFAQYRLQSTIQEVVFVSQDEVLIDRYVRQSDNNWLLSSFRKTSDVFSFGTILVSIPVSRICREASPAHQTADVP